MFQQKMSDRKEYRSNLIFLQKKTTAITFQKKWA